MSENNTTKDIPIAVALKYNQGEEPAPHVAATGKGAIAEQIIAIAKEHNVTIKQDKDLANILSVLDVDSIIPLDAYVAVAEILSYIYNSKQRSPS